MKISYKTERHDMENIVLAIYDAMNDAQTAVRGKASDFVEYYISTRHVNIAEVVLFISRLPTTMDAAPWFLKEHMHDDKNKIMEFLSKKQEILDFFSALISDAISRRNEERYFSMEDIANKLGMNRETIRTLIRSGEMEAYQIGTRYRISESSFREFLQHNKTLSKRERRAQKIQEENERRKQEQQTTKPEKHEEPVAKEHTEDKKSAENPEAKKPAENVAKKNPAENEKPPVNQPEAKAFNANSSDEHVAKQADEKTAAPTTTNNEATAQRDAQSAEEKTVEKAAEAKAEPQPETKATEQAQPEKPEPIRSAENPSRDNKQSDHKIPNADNRQNQSNSQNQLRKDKQPNPQKQGKQPQNNPQNNQQSNRNKTSRPNVGADPGLLAALGGNAQELGFGNNAQQFGFGNNPSPGKQKQGHDNKPANNNQQNSNKQSGQNRDGNKSAQSELPKKQEVQEQTNPTAQTPQPEPPKSEPVVQEIPTPEPEPKPEPKPDTPATPVQELPKKENPVVSSQPEPKVEVELTEETRQAIVDDAMQMVLPEKKEEEPKKDDSLKMDEKEQQPRITGLKDIDMKELSSYLNIGPSTSKHIPIGKPS